MVYCKKKECKYNEKEGCQRNDVIIGENQKCLVYKEKVTIWGFCHD